MGRIDMSYRLRVQIFRWTFPVRKTVCNRQPGWCRLVPGIDKGSTDIQVLPNGLAFVTSGFDPHCRGDILLFDFKKPRLGAHAVDIVGDLDRSTFSPVGLSIWRDYNSNVIYIFVVNARDARKDTVEKFRFDEKGRKLYHLRTYRDPTFTHLDDIVATGEDSFYFTNIFKFDFEVELLRRLSLGNVGFYDGSRGRIVLAGRNTPDGINTSPDGKYVYLTEIGMKRLSVYIRESDNTLTLTQPVNMSTFPPVSWLYCAPGAFATSCLLPSRLLPSRLLVSFAPVSFALIVFRLIFSRPLSFRPVTLPPLSLLPG
ncbi:Serum paraoxonase/arylesterase 1 [Lamellibrachia satsuma]|nr:Serum paraoxonase/arylesterase 1 [Lamellibrachia satsuma]